jgi:predicted dehydrogenase
VVNSKQLWGPDYGLPTTFHKLKGGLILENIVKWGVIGSGGIAKRRTIPEGIISADNARLIAVYDTDSDVNELVAEKYSAKAVNSIDGLINSGVDVVYVASPAAYHIEHAISVARGKKHVFCEKPLGLTVTEAEKIISVCHEEGVLLGTGLMMRFSSQHQAALKLIQEGQLGKPVFCRAQLSCWYPPIKGAWRQDPSMGGGGSLMDMGSHCIDLLEMFFGNVKSVSCQINNIVHPFKSEDSSVVTLLFENGAIGSVDAYFCIPDNSSKNVLELYGSKGSILASGTIGQGCSGNMVAYLEQDASGYNAQQIRANGEGILINPTPVNTYCAEIKEFSQAILEKRNPLNNGGIGLQSQKVMAACYESAKTGKVINVE